MKNIIEFLICNSKTVPEKIFCEDENEKFTYFETYNLAKNIALSLNEQGLTKKPILIKAERNCKTLISILGIVFSNNYYVPINPEFSEEKLNSILESSKAEYEICFDAESKNCKTLYYKDIVQNSLNNTNSLIEEFNEENNLYEIYTSGSTGKPKGVLKSQKNMMAFVENFLSTFHFEHKSFNIANQTPLFFDASMKDVYLALATSSTIYFPNKTLFSMPAKLIEFLNDKKIDFICWVPSALSIVVKLRTFNFIKPEHLKYVFFVGETFTPKYLNMWIDALPQITYVNLYGSTELSGVCLYKVVDKKIDEENAIPLGKPLKNNNVYLDEGEIIVESEQIAIGYINNEEKNKQVFFIKDGKKHLRTGDFAYVNDDGDFVFLTRKDFQVKHMGYRIELQEIELSIANLEYIDSSAVVYDYENKKIVCIATLNKNLDSPTKIIASDLKQKLPEYMLPNKYIFLDKMPLNANGKIDREKIKNMI